MGKKKVAPQTEEPKEEASQPQPHSNTHQTKSIDAPSEKLQNLKSLNSLLIKESFERRQQVESLEQAKQALEADLTRSGMEREQLMAEVTQVLEKSFEFLLEKVVLCAVWESRMVELSVGLDGLVREKDEIETLKGEREAEIGFLKKEIRELGTNLESESDRLTRVSRERDLLKNKTDRLTDEVNGWREKLAEIEKKESKSVKEIEKLKVEFEGLLRENLKTEKAVKALKSEKESVEGNLKCLKSEIESVVREKSEVERERTTQEVKIAELEKEVKELNEFVMNLQQEKELLQAKALELEKMIGEAMEKEKKMVIEICTLEEEKREKEQNSEKLKDQLDLAQRMLDTTSNESSGRLQQIGELIQEKNEIEEAKLSLQRETIELNTEVGGLRNVISNLQESCRNEEDKIKHLESELDHYRNAFDQVTLERENVEKGFDEKKKKVENMEVVVLEKEKRIEETMEELKQMRRECENLIERKKAIESHVELLEKEKDLLQRNLVESQRIIDDLSNKVESAGIKSERALSMVKNTAALVCYSADDRDSKEGVTIKEQKLDEEMQSYTVELDAIKNAFRSKEKMLEDMKQHVDILQNAVDEAHKRKSFWAVVSSATTIFAAASVAYAARGR